MINQEYRDKPSVSQSFIKQLEGYPKYLTLGEKKKSKAFEIGSLVDLLITDKENFDREYVIYDKAIPTEKMKLLADRYVELALIDLEMGLEVNHVNTVLQARVDVDFDSRLKSPTVLDKFDEAAYDYTKFVLANPNRLVISRNDYLWAIDMVNSAIYDDICGYWLTSDESNTALFQQPLYFLQDNVECKALPDVIHINHKKKQINLIDIKTYEGDFASNFFKFEYYYQAEWYMEAMRKRYNETLIPEGYELKDFFFLAIDKSRFKPTLLYKHPTRYKNIIWYGGVLTDNRGRGVKVKGLYQLLEEYRYFSTTGNWDYPYNYLKQKFVEL